MMKLIYKIQVDFGYLMFGQIWDLQGKVFSCEDVYVAKQRVNLETWICVKTSFVNIQIRTFSALQATTLLSRYLEFAVPAAERPEIGCLTVD